MRAALAIRVAIRVDCPAPADERDDWAGDAPVFASPMTPLVARAMTLPSRRADRLAALMRLAAEQLRFVLAYKRVDRPWSEAELAALARLRAAGVSYSECARTLTGRSRNACISKSFRAEIDAATSDACMDPAVVARRMPLVCERVRAWAGDVTALPSAGVTFLALEAGMCRWPFGDGAGMRFCGLPVGKGTAKGASYCAEHAGVAAEDRNNPHKHDLKPGGGRVARSRQP
jgi:hypothetical protein